MNDLTTNNQKQEEQNERIIRLLEEQLAQSNRQIEVLTEQVRQLTKALYDSKSEKSKYQAPDGQVSLFEDDPSFNESEQTEKQSTETISYTVTRKKTNKISVLYNQTKTCFYHRYFSSRPTVVWFNRHIL